MDVVVILRAVLALLCVFGLLWFMARRAGGKLPAARRAPALSVVARQTLGGRSAVALVEVSGRRLLLGVGEHGVTLLTEVEAPAPTQGERVELDADELERLLELPEPDPAPIDLRSDPRSTYGAGSAPATTPSSPAARMPAVPTPRNPLEGSILAPTTWRRAVEAVQERTLRR